MFVGIMKKPIQTPAKLPGGRFLTCIVRPTRSEVVEIVFSIVNRKVVYLEQKVITSHQA